ncbi:hypothetical protein SAMN02745134_00956 [Clostridium acidisoli DSM 12555]|uniref:Uncharacterized protein n=1 Tax=Clostridium acidisoli DSM 12555 TaxID=1121291 RepID=A0A1W1X7V5_9CLOT|nr:hypothetical protein [Clostridium acidisoli]SMC19894.1 hypothetical protein SAMN02745134_00956 [Clostridium acidisoli DSM 12555]
MFKENKHVFPIFSAKVEYDYSKQMTLIIEDINEFYAELLNNLIGEIGVDYKDVIDTIKTVLNIKVINYSFFFKDDKYDKEEECRVLFLVADKYNNEFLKYRDKNGRDIPYIEVKFKKKSLLNIRCV